MKMKYPCIVHENKQVPFKTMKRLFDSQWYVYAEFVISAALTESLSARDIAIKVNKLLCGSCMGLNPTDREIRSNLQLVTIILEMCGFSGLYEYCPLRGKSYKVFGFQTVKDKERFKDAKDRADFVQENIEIEVRRVEEEMEDVPKVKRIIKPSIGTPEFRKKYRKKYTRRGEADLIVHEYLGRQTGPTYLDLPGIGGYGAV